ncbi:VOC family protein [Jiulongibacter sp. NS-SX5]|uniref:VOC family protein n=1 Tax=Jiulongibacter sp. NS-SX5 TaxID=3463854 RepID=UPI00405838A2
MNLNQITVPALNLSQSVPFYQKLGLKLIVDDIPNYVRFECPEGDATFSIQQTDRLPEGDGIHVYFECKNLDEKVDQLKGMGFIFDQEPKDQSWLWREAKLKDPDGNVIILYFAGENRLNPPWRVK